MSSGLASAPRAVWLTLAAIVAAVNLHATYIIGSVQSYGWVVAFSNLFGLSAILLFALYGLWTIGQEDSAAGTQRRLSRADAVVLGVALLASLIPWHIAAFAALVLLAGWCWITSVTGSVERRAAVIMLAIAGSIAIGRILLHSVGDNVVSLDAQFVGWLAGVPVRGNVVDFASTGASTPSFIVGLPCSSVHNMSQAVLLWATVTQLLRQKIDAALVGFAVMAMLGLFLVNAVRLAAMAWYPAHFETIHNGIIGELFGLASLIVAALIVAAGALHAHRRQT